MDKVYVNGNRETYTPLCGHGRERVIRKGKEELKVDRYEQQTNAVYEYHGCK